VSEFHELKADKCLFKADDLEMRPVGISKACPGMKEDCDRHGMELVLWRVLVLMAI
jgi:hypothetical protein